MYVLLLGFRNAYRWKPEEQPRSRYNIQTRSIHDPGLLNELETPIRPARRVRPSPVNRNSIQPSSSHVVLSPNNPFVEMMNLSAPVMSSSHIHETQAEIHVDVPTGQPAQAEKSAVNDAAILSM